jgi:acetyl esterase/lipase
MTPEPRIHEIALKTVVHRVRGMDTVTVARDIPFSAADGSPLAFDLYAPPATGESANPPVVVIVAGFPDAGFHRMLGCRFKEMGSTVSWARLMAASGIAAIAYANREPAADLDALLRHLRESAPALGIDENRLGLWASSGNAPLALWALTSGTVPRPRCAALLYPFTLDRAGHTAVADAARRFHFAHPGAGRSVVDLPGDVPIFVARAGRDENPGLNETLDRFVFDGFSRNLPIAVTNHPTGPHAFDLLDEGSVSRRIVGEVLAFLRASLLG